MINEIQVGRLNGLLHKLLDMKEGAPSPTLASDVFPNIVLESDRPEWKFLAGERLGAGYRYDAAVAGQYSHAGLYNPAGSNVLVIVEQMQLIPTVNGSAYIRLEANYGRRDAVGYCTIRDPRGWGGPTAPQTTAQPFDYTNAVASVGYPLGLWYIAANTLFTYNQPIVLPPGYEVYGVMSAVNQGITAMFSFRERKMERSETR